MKNGIKNYSALLVLAMLVSTVLIAVSFRQDADGDEKDAPQVLRNEQAVKFLKQTGGYDSLSEALTAARYKFEQTDAVLSAENPAHQIQARFDENGSLQISGTSENWQTVFRLKSFGRGQNQTAVGGGSWQMNGSRAELRRTETGLTEYFENRPDGLEQGFILNEKPSGEENLSLILQTGGELKAAASADGQKIILTDASGAEILAYDKLKVWDANQNNLTARMTTDETGEIRLEVEDANAAYPLTIDPTFIQRARLTANDGNDGDLFGASVAISGNTAVIGAPGDSFNDLNLGAAYVFVLNGINWSQQAKLTANDGAGNDFFGRSVSISGDTVVVGASGDDAAKGSAYVFVRNNTTWSPQEKLTASDGVAGDLFGNSVSISGETVAVGANGDDNGANTNQGSAYVYVRSGGVWTFQQKLLAVLGTANAQFGKSLSLTGGTVIIGAYTETVSGNAGQGAAYVFVRSGTTWSQQIRLTASDGTPDDNFGSSVDLSLTVTGAVAVIGADNDNIAGNAAQGSAYVFNRSLAGVWTQTQKLIGTFGDTDDRFGSSVAVTPTTAANIYISADGTFRAFVFKRVNSVWNEQQRLFGYNNGSLNFDNFSSVAVSGETVIIGSETDSVGGNGNVGTAYIYKFGGSPFDFDGDEKTDVSIFRPSNGQWWINRSSDASTISYAFGQSTDRIAPADFTGDGKTDIAFFRPSNGTWYYLRSENNTYIGFQFGTNGDIPAPADYNLDGRADAVVFRPSTGTWYISYSSGSTSIVQFGTMGDVPVAADYDGDGKADIAIFRPSDGSWWYLRSSDSQFRVFRFGVSTDKPVPGDWTGDGKADIAVFRPSTGEWFVQRSEDNSFYSVPFGASGDTPAPGDYDGDGKFDTAVFRPSNATWYVNRSASGVAIQQFGVSGDKPVPNAFVP